MKRLLLYNELAEWWPLCSAPSEYKEEAEIYRRVLVAHSSRRPVTLLELGSGGGNNASHLKQHFKMTLVDLSPGMLRVSRALNPECKHVRGDMRKVRLGRQFDAVFIHDAIDYMLTLGQLSEALQTAFVHCRPGGVALFVPDWTAERFRASSSHGGHDVGNRGLRYLEWSIDHDPRDRQYSLYMSYLLREGRRVRQVELDEHKCGLFSEREWLKAIRDVGFRARKLPYEHSSWERHAHVMFMGVKPAA
ncbi:MAG: class I SAM-dependent methyltransferase [Chloroflexota bacterium]